MNRFKLSKAGIRAGEGIERFGGNAQLYERVLGKFSEDPNFALLCTAIEKRDAQAGFQAAHALKGLAGNLSLIRLYEDILPLVEELRGGSLENADALLLKVRQDYDDALSAINA